MYPLIIYHSIGLDSIKGTVFTHFYHIPYVKITVVENMKICAVVLEDAARSFDKIYHYHVPGEFEGKLGTGIRVSVPFGRSKAPRTAWFL